MNETRIQETLATLLAERADVARRAELQLAYYTGAIEALERLLQPAGDAGATHETQRKEHAHAT